MEKWVEIESYAKGTGSSKAQRKIGNLGCLQGIGECSSHWAKHGYEKRNSIKKEQGLKR